MSRFLIVFFFVNLTSISIAQPAGYGYGKHILIQSSQVAAGADLNNFPMLISITDADLRTVSNGGHLENTNGFDIIFTAGDCVTPLDFQVEMYEATTGELVVWVKIPVLSTTVNTGIHLYYGNSSIVANPSSSSIWSAGYDGVWHLHSNFLDASGNTNNGTNNGSTNVSPANNSADGQHFVDPSHWIELTNHPNRTGDFSYSGWFYTNDRTRSGQRVICDDQSNANGCHAISIGDPGTGRIRFYIRGMSPVSLDSPNLVSNNTWHHITVTYNNTSKLKAMYVDGALVASATVTGTLGTATGNASIGGEVTSGESGNRFHGDLDEIRSIPAVLSANWITTEYNNQSNPASFYTISAEFTAAILCATLPIELIDLTASIQNSEVVLNWSTASESNNDYFEIQHANEELNWLTIDKVPGSGSSSNLLHYETVDRSPFLPTTYYRLKQVDFNGSITYSKTIAVSFNDNAGYTIWPNPSTDFFNLSITNKTTQVEIYDSQGKLLKTINAITENILVIPTGDLHSGVYYLNILESSKSQQLKFVVSK